MIVIISAETLDPRHHLFWRNMNMGRRLCIGPFTLQRNTLYAGPFDQWEIREANGNWLARGDEAYIKWMFDKIELQYLEALMTDGKPDLTEFDNEHPHRKYWSPR